MKHWQCECGQMWEYISNICPSCGLPSPAQKEEGLAVELDHPCKETCSGWKQGFERGAQMRQKLVRQWDAEKYIQELEAKLTTQTSQVEKLKEELMEEKEKVAELEMHLRLIDEGWKHVPDGTY